MTVWVPSDALRQPFRQANSAIAEPSSWATFPNENARRPLAPKRFGPIWSVPMHAATVSFPLLIDSCTTGAARSTSHVVMMMSAPWLSSFAAQAFAIAGLLFWVLQVMSFSLILLVLLTCAILVLAVASAGP